MLRHRRKQGKFPALPVSAMCTTFILFHAQSQLLLLIAFNRDEFFDRATQEASWWEDHPELLAGRDKERGGTWLGVTRSGRFALLTNFRESQDGKHYRVEAASRGELTINFLLNSTHTPLQYLEDLEKKATTYNGMNLLVGDVTRKEASYLTNRSRGVPRAQDLQPGLYGLSNGTLGDRWAKVERGKAMLQQLADSGQLDGPVLPWDKLFGELLGDRQEVEDLSQLPATGIPPDVEQRLSSIFVKAFEYEGKLFGTRSQTVLAVWASGLLELRELYTSDGVQWAECRHAFQMQTKNVQ